jgi:IS605 OrfB family transposase
MSYMKLVAQIQLKPTEHQHALLKATLERANAACNAISQYAWKHQMFSHYALHKEVYVAIRDQFSLAAQMVVRCLAKVGDAYKLDKNAKRFFKSHGSIAYDSRILKYRTDKQLVSIWTLPGREPISYVCGEHQRELLQHQKGESDLVYHRGKWYLLATCEIDEPTPAEVDRWLGVDRGVVNLAADSDGEIYAGDLVEARREWITRRRKELQQTNTKSARKRLRKLAGKQDRFQRHVNHCISKQLVLKAKRTKQGIALENLTGINLRTRVRHEDRAKRGNWSFDQLGSFISYKARLYGVRVKWVDPRYTSQRCNKCGHTEKANRGSQAEFHCQNPLCGHTAHADVNAALNISEAAPCMRKDKL